MALRKISSVEQNRYKDDLDKISSKLIDNLEKISSDQWTDLASVSHTIKQLKRKGYRKEAEKIMQLGHQVEGGAIMATESLIGSQKQKEAKETANKIVKEKIIGSDDMLPSAFLHRGSNAARAVCRIIEKDSRNPLGTGFLISDRLIMTNNHVINSPSVAKGMIVQFDFFADGSGQTIIPCDFELKPHEFFMTNPENALDFSIIAVSEKSIDGQKAISSFGRINLIEETGKARVGNRLNIVHHPQGQAQRISIRKNLLVILEDSDPFLQYMADTEPGSSGSPVLNDDWELVALHRASETIVNEEQKELFLQHIRKIDKGMAQEFTDEEVRINMGVRISVISNHVKGRMGQFNMAEQKLIQTIFATDDTFVEPQNADIGGLMPYKKRDYINMNPPLDGPVNVTINIGNRSLSSQFQEYSELQNPSFGKSDLKSQLEIFNTKINTQKSVFKAFKFLEEARDQEYLPSSSKLNTRKSSYYGNLINNIKGGSFTKKKAYDSLHKLLSDTLSLVEKFPDQNEHLESLLNQASLESISLEGGGKAYAMARAHLYTWVDLQEDRMLQGVYTLAPIAPEQLLLKDLITSLKIDDVELPRRFNNNQFLNCEHIVPKSLFDNEKFGFSDMHHLISAEGATNNFRSARTFRQLKPDEGEKGPTNLVAYIDKGGKRTSKFFEPENNKPLVARATLYFIVCHKNKLSTSEYDRDAVKTLIEWSNLKKPSRYEKHRNESIFKLQGNRNPFIDFPDWVDKVDFMQGLSQ